MNIPGFTAEASLCSATSVYRATANVASKLGKVQMQQPFFGGNYYCYREENTGFTRCCECSSYYDQFGGCRCYTLRPPELFPDPEAPPYIRLSF
jgi:hypothetical protein